MAMQTIQETAQESGWEAESPFVADPRYAPPARVPPAPAQAFGPSAEVESPFIAEYVSENGAAVPSAQAEAFATVFNELYDREFDEAVTDLVNEAGALAEERFAFEGGTPEQQRIEADRGLREYFAPLDRESQAMLDRLAAGIRDTDLRSLTEAEREALLERFAPSTTGLPPSFENFVGKLFKKAKAAVKKVSGILPHNLILNKLKTLAKPLIDRVLKTALNKLPVALRPIAGQLAKKFLGLRSEQEDLFEEPAEAAAADPAEIQRELDALLAGYIVQGEAFERQAVIEQFIAEAAQPAADPLTTLEASREQFVERLTQMQEAEDPTPAVQQFIPAILPALKLGISVVGRPRVVNFLAGMVAKLISKYVGKQQATALSRAMVDTGLRLISLEAQALDEPKQAAYAIASTVEETINNLVTSAPAEAWESEALLEAYARDAFEKAAVANFPDPVIRPELHEAAAAPGTWVMMPLSGGRKRYKKYTQIFDVTITPQVAAAIKTFGGTSLQAVLRDQLGVSTGSSLTARVHLYEAIPGSTLSLIAFHEKGVPGLGHARRMAWSQIHPLTPQTAGLLLKEPGLGRGAPARFLADRNLIDVGQRFFYLETRQAVRVRPPRGAAPGSEQQLAQTTQTSVLLDFPKRQVRLFLYYSETDAQSLATNLRKRLPVSTIATAMRAGLDVRLTTVLSGDPNPNVKVIHEATPTERMLPALAGQVLRFVGKELAKLLIRWAVEALMRELQARYDAFTANFAKAAADGADGVTVVLVFQHATLIDRLRQWMGSGMLGRIGTVIETALTSFRTLSLGTVSLEIRSGFVRW
jgi:hypothetical protein